MTEVTNYKCPACTGPLRFSGDVGKLVCDHCGSAYEVAEIEALYAAKDEAAATAFETAKSNDGWNTDTAGGDWGAEAQGMRAYGCPSCGAEIICDMTTAATACPYCGNTTIVPGQFGGTKRPDYVIPFRQGRDAAIAALKKHYKGKFLLPKVFTANNHIEEVKGVYVPFWLFDARMDGSAKFDASNSTSHREGDYIITTTSHYDVYRSGSMAFSRVPVDGSQKMPDDYMDSIEPFDYNDLQPFSMAYLAGFMADKYDVDATEASKRANLRCAQSTFDALEKTVTGYAEVSIQQKSISLQPGEIKYALFPVWILNTVWNGKNYLFTMNGQTGKMVGDLPADKGKKRLVFWGTFLGLLLILSLLLSKPIGELILRLILTW